MAHPNLLRPTTQRLVSTPVKDLPQIAPFLASSIAACFEVLQSRGGVIGDEDAVLVHKLKTRISALLQDRSAEGRLAAAIMVKATIEAGGYEILSTSEPWVRVLIGNLNKADPAAAKKIYIITITRIFSLTQGRPTLLREISTPLLAAFVTNSLNLLKPKVVSKSDSTRPTLSPLLQSVLQSWLHILPQSPATFRPFVARMQAICLSIIGDLTAPQSVTCIASQLLASLHLSAPKNGSSAQWHEMCKATIHAAHETCDELFRAVLEDWVTSDPVLKQRPRKEVPRNEPFGQGSEGLDLPKWSGVHQGAFRVKTLLTLLGDLLSNQTTQSVSVPVGTMIDLVTRITSVIIPSVSKDSQYNIRLSQEISRDEREALWTEMPTIHRSCLGLLSRVVKVFDSTLLPVCRSLFDTLLWTFETEAWHTDIRANSYDLLGLLLPLFGCALMRADVKSLSSLVRFCCRDLSFRPTDSDRMANGHIPTPTTKSSGSRITNADAFLSSDKSSPDSCLSVKTEVQRAAHELLPLILVHIPTDHISQSLRAEIDKTAILAQHKEAMLASVLNPAPGQKGKPGPASIMPFLARASAQELENEALLRPRMPVVRSFQSNANGIADDEDDTQEDAELLEETKACGPDLPSRLEQSSETRQSRPNTAIEKEAPPVMVMHESDQPHPESEAAQGQNMSNPSILKRGFGSVDEAAPSFDDLTTKTPVVIPWTAATHPSPKRARLGDDQELVDPLSRAVSQQQSLGEVEAAFAIGFGAASIGGEAAQAESTSAIAVPSVVPVSTVPSTSTATLPSTAEVDSDDSEIPTIDIEPDTSDEDDEEDEEMYEA